MADSGDDGMRRLKERVPAAVVEALIEYARSGQDVETFLKARHGAAVGAALLEQVREVRERAQEVSAARARGVSPAAWLGERLTGGDTIKPNEIEGLDRLMPGVDLEDTSAPRVGKAVLDAVKVGLDASFGEEALGEGLELLDAMQDVPVDVRGLADRFFTSPLGDEAEIIPTAAAASGVMRAMEALGMRPDVAQATFVADVGLHAAKVGYKLVSGELPGIDEAAELIEDRIAANIGAAAGRIFQSGAPKVGAAIGAMIEAVVPMGGAAIQAGRVVGGLVGAVLRPAIEQGVRTVTKHVLSAAREVVKGVGQAVVSTVKKLFVWMLS